MTISATPVTPQPIYPASALEVPACNTQASDCNYRCDDVAAPVHNVQNRAFDCRRLLALDCLAELGRGAEVLCGCCERSRNLAEEDQSQCEFEKDVNPVGLARSMK